MLLRLYQIISIALVPIFYFIVMLRKRIGKEHKIRFYEKFAITNEDFISKSTSLTPQEIRNKKVILLHAVSVGESNSVINFAKKLLEEEQENFILFTTTTTTSAELVKEALLPYKDRAIHQFLPLDSYLFIIKFLNFWQPKLIFITESEIWPNLLFVAKKRGIKTFLINARLSQNNIKIWHLLSRLNFRIFDNFTAIFSQDEVQKQSLKSITKSPIYYFGNLKHRITNANNNPKLIEKIKNFQLMLNGKTILLAASTHKGEEEAIFKVFNNIKDLYSDLILILAPRHPNRTEAIIEIAKNKFDLNEISLHSKQQKIHKYTDIYLIDTIGELELFYYLANFTFLGGSLVNVGGHNPFEAITNHCAIITGPYFFNNQSIFEMLNKNKLVNIAINEDELQITIEHHLKSPEYSLKIANQAFATVFGKDSSDLINQIIEVVNCS